jgi:murein DD-endopeptidase MepM/ murein hydrolase activator NlpD
MGNNNNKKTQSNKPSVLVTLICLLLAMLLPYFLITHYKPKTNHRVRSIVLPKPEKKMALAKPKIVKHAHDKEWKFVITKPGDTLSSIFKQLGLNKSVLSQMLEQNPHADKLKAIRPHQKLKFLFSKNKQLEKIVIPLTINQNLNITKKNDRYVSTINSKKMQTHSHYITATVYDSLYSTAKKKHIPYKLIKQMTQIFNWDIDFSKDVRKGDTFTIIYQAHYVEDKRVGTGDILALNYTNKGKTYRAIRYKTNAKIEYYTPEGKNLRKAFARFPVRFNHISSSFSYARNHPVLNHTVRPHKGVDLAAPIGTPIKATADGIIVRIGRNGGYGNMIKIKHNKKYATIYAHMLKFQRGLSNGKRVKKGQVIGYVGQTGLADGPHCHYEFHANGVAKNPVTITLPHAKPISQSQFAAYHSYSTALLAQLQLYEDAQKASHNAVGIG